MQTKSVLALTVTLALAPTSIALGATLFAGPLTTYSNSSRCLATNVSPKPLALSVTLIAIDGSDANTSSCPAVGPGQTCYADGGVGNTCRITYKGGKNAVRGTLEVNFSGIVVATSTAR